MMSKPKNINTSFIHFIIIFLLSITFFIKLFFPEPRLFYTPSYERSYIWNQNYPFKDFLADSIKKGELPLWTEKVGTGFAMFAEGQVGSLNFSNLILFYIFPAWLAWNLSYLIIFITCFSGTYFLLKYLGVSGRASLFSALAFSFGGYFVARVANFNYIQSASFMPWLFLVGIRLWKKHSIKLLFLFALILSQQIFSGGYQWVFITVVGIAVFLLSSQWDTNMDELIKKIGLMFIAMILGFTLAAPQLLSTLEYKNLSIRRNSIGVDQIFQYPFGWKNILGFIYPNFDGTPKDGSYTSPFEKNRGIYWENQVYMGIFPLIFFVIFLFKKKKNDWEKSFLFLLIFSLLLALGQAAPLSFVYTFPLFNQFKVTARFLILTTFSLSILCGVGLDEFFKKVSIYKHLKGYKAYIFSLLFLMLIIDLYVYGFDYHPMVSVQQALAPPDTVELISADSRVFTSPKQGEIWNEVMLKEGWEEPAKYLYLKNGMDADLNLLFDRSNVNLYSDFQPIRQLYSETFIPSLFNATSAEFIISPGKIDDVEGVELVSIIKSEFEELSDYFVYKNLNYIERFRFVSDYVSVKSMQDVETVLAGNDFSFRESVIVEREIEESFDQLEHGLVEIIEDKNDRIKLSTDTDKRTILVIADSYYPSWKALVNEEEVEIIPANLNQRAIILPPGKNIVEMYYSKSLLIRGIVISLSSILTVLLVFQLQSKGFFKRLIYRLKSYS